MARRTERVADLPATTRLKLFRYPHKFGGGSSWCVGFEMKRPDGEEPGRYWVSQHFISEWSEDRAEELSRFEAWTARLGCAGSREDRHG